MGLRTSIINVHTSTRAAETSAAGADSIPLVLADESLDFAGAAVDVGAAVNANSEAIDRDSTGTNRAFVFMNSPLIKLNLSLSGQPLSVNSK